MNMQSISNDRRNEVISKYRNENDMRYWNEEMTIENDQWRNQ